MSARVLWQIGGVIGFVVILIVGWFLLVSPKYASVGMNDRLRSDVERQNVGLESAISDISTVDVAALEAQVSALHRLVPEAVEEPEILRQFDAAAAAAGVELKQVTFDVPSVFVATPEGASSAPLPIDPADLQAVVDAGLLVVPFSTNALGDVASLLAYADALQSSGRLFLLQSVEFGSPNESGVVPVVIRGLAFVLPAAAAG
jgi:hypothetical protein